MPLESAYSCVYNGLIDRDEPMFVGSRSSISIRLEVRSPVTHDRKAKLTVFLQWPDCPSWAQQVRCAASPQNPGLTIDADENEGLEA